jgi:hypothetical protein
MNHKGIGLNSVENIQNKVPLRAALNITITLTNKYQMNFLDSYVTCGLSKTTRLSELSYSFFFSLFTGPFKIVVFES